MNVSLNRNSTSVFYWTFRGISKNSAIRLKVNGTSCKCEQLQSVLTNVETIEEADVRRPIRMRKNCVMIIMIVEQSSEMPRSQWYRCRQFVLRTHFVFSHTILLWWLLEVMCTFAQWVFVNVSQTCRPLRCRPYRPRRTIRAGVKIVWRAR